jgi:hypothetical protein
MAPARRPSVNELRYFLILAQQVYFVLTGFFPITLLLLVAWVWAFVATKPEPKGGRWQMFLLGCLPPFAIPVAILVCGVLFVSEPAWETGVEPPAYPSYIITLLLLAHLPLAGLLVWRWGKRWPAVVASSVCAGYVSLAAWLISSMSVTGVWL